MSRPYQSYTIGSNSGIKRFSHHKRFQKVLDLCKKFAPSSLLDVGTGDAYFLTLVHHSWTSPIILHATEPEPDHFAEAEKNLENIPESRLFKDWQPIDRKYEVICCQEVLEHLQDHHLEMTLEKMKSHLEKGGHIIASVPIETGVAGLFKNIIRVMSGAKHRGTHFKSIFRSALGLPVQRIINPNGYISSHIGFRLTPLEKAFEKAGLHIVQISYSPLPIGGALLNSQKIYVLKPL